MELYYATTNPGKIVTLQKDMEKYRIKVIQVSMDIPEPRSSDVSKIAREKALYAFKKLNKPVVALDAGFYIDSLNGFPRAFVNFVLETIDIDGILQLCKGKDRKCEFRHCLAYMDGSIKEPKLFLDHVKGKLSDRPKGVMQKHLWSRLSLIFIPENSKKTLAEMNYDEYLEWRKIAREQETNSRLFGEWITNRRINNNFYK